MAASSSSSTATTSLVEPAPYAPLEPLPRKDHAFESVPPNVSKPEALEVMQPSGNAAARPEQSLWRASLIIGTLSGITLTSSMTTGLLTVALPTMATDLGLSDALLLWPASIYGLTSGCSLMIAGTIADVVGSRVVYLVGCFLLTGFILGSGLAETSTQLIAFRGGQGVAVSIFQRVQGVSAIRTSLYFIPNIVIGVVLSVATGFMLHRISVYWLVLIACCLTAVAPLLMAVNDPDWSYWYASFWAVLLSPLSSDSMRPFSFTTGGQLLIVYQPLVLFVVSALIITSTFPDNTQALAGAVFNTFSQFGIAVGLTVVAVISSSVSQSSATSHAHSRMVAGEATYAPQNLLKGYQASFWALFGVAMLACAIGAFGLRNVSNKGMKKD
ncbi:hypothetical protein DL769_010493 [Monosporascus sp. CRB-8-3]|nr:hypothetical protein DL769_010493 [Monosporascus sp. CRB-8-3]